MNFDPSLLKSYEYFHYTGEDINTLNLNRRYSQIVRKYSIHTPNGLWLSIAGKKDWLHYYYKNIYQLETLKTEFQVFFKPTAKILLLQDNSVFDEFIKEYGYYSQDNAEVFLIRWEKVIRSYQGIALPCVLPNLPKMANWNKIWLSTSACIWDLQAIEKVDNLGEVNVSLYGCCSANTGVL